MQILNGAQLKDMIIAASANLTTHKNMVDALNVFPVPDGDTGTNMALTLQAAAKEVQNLEFPLISAVAQKAASGSLMGARGNSGVILSQLLRGFAQGLGSKTEANSRDLATALQNAVDTAYKGVMKPVEGTILTVAREAAKAALDNCRHVSDVTELLNLTIVQAKKTLAQTPNMLPILKQVGVVDAGGKGLVVILEGALAALTGQTITTPDEAQQDFFEAVSDDVSTIDLADIKFHYCTEFIVKGKELPLEKMKEALSVLGDSLMVVGTDEVAKVHVHSNHPGQVLEICLGHGALHEIKISNMVGQHEEMQQQTATQEQFRELGVVAVAAGDGLQRIFKSLGVDQLVEGGQTQNPSIQDIVNAINKVKAQQVFVLPNNKNIILAAEQAKELVDREIFVVPSTSIPQGIAALINFEPEAAAQANFEKMQRAVSQVVTGEVTYAIRDSKIDGQDVAAGDILGLGDGKIVVVGKEVTRSVLDLVQRIMPDGGEIITVFYGQDVTEDAAKAVRNQIEEAFPDCEVELHYGGQPLYYYLVSIE